jgi:hypothetical protein
MSDNLFDPGFVGRIPANPVINTKGQHDAQVANQDLSVRGREVRRVVIPRAPVDIEVPVAPPAARRHFDNPNAIGGRPLRRD